jgi:hypothetical protein
VTALVLLLYLGAAQATAAPGGQGRPNPYAQAFWSRDLGTLARTLEADGPPAAHDALFRDLLALVTCREPPALREDDADPDLVLRELVRLERARMPQGLREVLANPAFFRRDVRPDAVGAGPLLVWPHDGERWPDEALQPAPLPPPCALADLQTALSPERLPSLNRLDQLRARAPAVAAPWAWMKAVDRYAAGAHEEAREALARADAAALEPSLRPFHAAMSGLLWPGGVSPVDLRAVPEGLRGAVALVACTSQVEQGDPERAVAVAEAVTPRDAPLGRCRAVALARAARVEEAQRALADRPGNQWDDVDRELARALSLATGDAAALGEAVVALPPAAARTWLADLGQAALQRGHLALASAAEAHLRSLEDAVAADVLAAERAFRTGDAVSLRRLLDALLDEDGERFRRGWERRARDRQCIDLLRRLVLIDAERGGARRPLLRDFEERLTFVAGSSDRRRLEELRALLAPDAPGLAGAAVRVLGTVALTRWPELPVPPPPAVAWPVPQGPLLAIPGPDGRLRRWFGDEDALAEVPDGR